jgi:uncharacterized protein YutE (UPF0331/DUF86 family)
VVDRERVLAKLDELTSYLDELRRIAPSNFEEYLGSIEKRRACERLLQISVEAVIDICALLVSGLRLGLPAEEDDLFEKLAQAGLLSAEMTQTLRRMRGFRNILVHEYGRVDDQVVFVMVNRKLSDFEEFQKEILEVLKTLESKEDSS